MCPSLHLALERASDEFAVWRAVPAKRRALAPSHWWSLAMALRGSDAGVPSSTVSAFGLPPQARASAVARVLLAAMADQGRQPWPGEFPERYRRDDEDTAQGDEAPNAPAAAQAEAVAVTPIA